MGNVVRIAKWTGRAPGDAPAGPESLLPLLAGARARGMADAFDLLGVAAILLDADGEALHVGAAAWRLMTPVLRLSAGRLRAICPREDADLQAMLLAAANGRLVPTLPISGESGEPILSLRLLPVDCADESAQLLRVVALLEPLAPA